MFIITTKLHIVSYSIIIYINKQSPYSTETTHIQTTVVQW